MGKLSVGYRHIDPYKKCQRKHHAQAFRLCLRDY